MFCILYDFGLLEIQMQKWCGSAEVSTVCTVCADAENLCGAAVT